MSTMQKQLQTAGENIRRMFPNLGFALVVFQPGEPESAVIAYNESVSNTVDAIIDAAQKLQESHYIGPIQGNA